MVPLPWGMRRAAVALMAVWPRSLDREQTSCATHLLSALGSSAQVSSGLQWGHVSCPSSLKLEVEMGGALSFEILGRSHSATGSPPRTSQPVLDTRLVLYSALKDWSG